MSLRPFFGYYGGKWRDTPRNYPAPAHGAIVEPFAGSAGYSTRYPDRRVILCEIDPFVAGVWRFLTRVTPAEVLRIPDLPLGGTVDDLGPLPEEAKWLVGFWLNKGNAHPCKSASAWMRSGKYPNSFWGERVKQTLAAQVEHIRHWRIVEGDYREIEVSEPATYFVDPPYRDAGKHYRFGPSQLDYTALAAWCRSRDGQVIACEATGADWLPFQEVAAIKTTRKGRQAKEALWIA